MEVTSMFVQGNRTTTALNAIFTQHCCHPSPGVVQAPDRLERQQATTCQRIWYISVLIHSSMKKKKILILLLLLLTHLRSKLKSICNEKTLNAVSKQLDEACDNNTNHKKSNSNEWYRYYYYRIKKMQLALFFSRTVFSKTATSRIRGRRQVYWNTMTAEALKNKPKRPLSLLKMMKWKKNSHYNNTGPLRISGNWRLLPPKITNSMNHYNEKKSPGQRTIMVIMMTMMMTMMKNE